MKSVYYSSLFIDITSNLKHWKYETKLFLYIKIYHFLVWKVGQQLLFWAGAQNDLCAQQRLGSGLALQVAEDPNIQVDSEDFHWADISRNDPKFSNR